MHHGIRYHVVIMTMLASPTLVYAWWHCHGEIPDPPIRFSACKPVLDSMCDQNCGGRPINQSLIKQYDDDDNDVENMFPKLSALPDAIREYLSDALRFEFGVDEIFTDPNGLSCPLILTRILSNRVYTDCQGRLIVKLLVRRLEQMRSYDPLKSDDQLLRQASKAVVRNVRSNLKSHLAAETMYQALINMKLYLNISLEHCYGDHHHEDLILCLAVTVTPNYPMLECIVSLLTDNNAQSSDNSSSTTGPDCVTKEVADSLYWVNNRFMDYINAHREKNGHRIASDYKIGSRSHASVTMIQIVNRQRMIVENYPFPVVTPVGTPFMTNNTMTINIGILTDDINITDTNLLFIFRCHTQKGHKTEILMSSSDIKTSDANRFGHVLHVPIVFDPTINISSQSKKLEIWHYVFTSAILLNTVHKNKMTINENSHRPRKVVDEKLLIVSYTPPYLRSYSPRTGSSQPARLNQRWPHPRPYFGAALAKSILVIVGGTSRNGHCLKVDILDIASANATWTLGPDSGLMCRQQPAVSSIDTNVYVCGTTKAYDETAQKSCDVWSGNKKHKTWASYRASADNKAYPCLNAHAQFNHEQRIYVHGGRCADIGPKQSSSLHSLSLLKADIFDEGTTIDLRPAYAHAGASNGTHLMICGGDQGYHQITGDCLLTKSKSTSHKNRLMTDVKRSQLLNNRFGHQMVAVGGQFFVFGGQSDDCRPFVGCAMMDVTEVYDDRTNTWVMNGTLSLGRHVAILKHVVLDFV